MSGPSSIGNPIAGKGRIEQIAGIAA